MRNRFCYNEAVLTISQKQARRFLLTKQRLLPPKKLQEKSGIAEVFDSLRLIQYDPLNPCGRNPDLVLQARIQNYHPQDYYTWLYKEKKGIECYDKELCIVPIEDFSFIYHRHFQAGKRQEIKRFVKRYTLEIEAVLEQIASTGPITSADIKSTLRLESGWGTSATFGRMVLEYLWRTGRVTVVKRNNGRKYYGLPDKHYGGSFITETQYPGVAKVHVLRRLKAVGMLPASGSGGGWQGIGPAKKTAGIIAKLVKEKQLMPVTVSGNKNTYVISREDGDILQREIALTEKRLSFIAPLDNLMWDRQMIADLFDFVYRWEVYTPLNKRQFGYYVLPILYGDMFVGRIEPVFADGTLVIKGLWKDTNWDKETQSAFEESLLAFQNYLGASAIVYT